MKRSASSFKCIEFGINFKSSWTLNNPWAQAKSLSSTL